MFTMRLVAIVCATLLAVPSLAVAGGPPATPGKSANGHAHKTLITHDDPPGPDASTASKARAYGRYCQDQKKRKHHKGEKGTSFSRCVHAMAKLATKKTTNPARACAPLSKEHDAGERDTPYGKCVSAAAKLREDR
jgi:hypothetical protein